MAPMAIDIAEPLPRREAWKLLPEPTIYPVQDSRFESHVPSQPDDYKAAKARPRSVNDAVIVIDNGSSAVRAGWSFEKEPRFVIPPIMAKYRDRKMGKTFSFVGADCYADTAARSHIRNAFEQGTGIVANWDVMEHILDFTFIKLGLNGADGAIDMPVVMTEAVANLAYSRKSMTEIIFECYGAPSLAYGIDSLFSYSHNKGSTGLVVSSSYSATHVIPVYNSKAILSQAIRLNWGGSHAAEYMLKLIRLKYRDYLSSNLKLNPSQSENWLKEFGYVSKDYDSELRTYLDWTGLEDRERIVQYPYTEEVVVQKTEEELAKIAERKKESGRRLQEQAAKMRLERLMKKERELEYFKSIQIQIAEQPKKETKRLLDEAEVKDEAALERQVKDLERSIRRARQKDLGGDPEEETEAPDFSLLEVPDDQLDEASLKTKRHQRLLKSNHDARARAKAEKEAEKARIAEEARLEEERRTNDFAGWLEEKQQARFGVLAKIKERERLDNEDREENPDVALKALEDLLLLHDPNFTYEHTREAQDDWSKKLLHAFERGPRPFDADSPAERHQIHLNVERIRVPEVLFQPSAIAGLDQAGLVEIAGDILTQRLTGLSGGISRDDFLRDVFLTGGLTLFPNFDHRLQSGLQALLPAGAPLRLRRAQDALTDAWRGAADWAGSAAWKTAALTKAEYQEKGADYLKEHDMGNAFA
ncbi:chromatin remodeling complex subunit [Grosmannia clavigera kw1407]|uniref:Chromatin remodeling complex subunit n=1 Tax=Grosmannia clavigera (strain kw1407 / UAMH 11150) TaxID=655863 RepID=F0XHV9_GROCL|nr:chromatin remodeling complex subunit [Grosmannia clavigera kw1407]EFX02970.1 chromatin remodeling complex subunit [Grosmannia clavigera kw1407]